MSAFSPVEDIAQLNHPQLSLLRPATGVRATFPPLSNPPLLLLLMLLVFLFGRMRVQGMPLMGSV